MREIEYRFRAADGVEISLHRLRGEAPATLPPVLLVPGTFTERTFWLGASGQGFARAVSGAGFDTWVLEQRGRDPARSPRTWTMDDWIALDAPAAAELLLHESGSGGFFWLGHSAGGVVGAAYSGSGLPGSDRLRGLVLVGAPGPGTLRGTRRLLARAGHLGAVALPWLPVPGRTLGMGPLAEPGRLVRDWLGWNLTGVWRDRAGKDYLAGLPRVESPVLAVAGAGDRLLAPPPAVRDLLERFGSADRTLLVAGRTTGYSGDLDHAGLIIGRTARAEVWPRILRWLEARAGVARIDGGGDT